MECPFMKAEEIAEILNVSIRTGQRIIKKLNKELEDKGFYTQTGRLSRQYFYERYYVKVVQINEAVA